MGRHVMVEILIVFTVFGACRSGDRAQIVGYSSIEAARMSLTASVLDEARLMLIEASGFRARRPLRELGRAAALAEGAADIIERSRPRYNDFTCSTRIRCNHPHAASVGWQPILQYDRVQEVLMRKKLLVGTVVAALATGMTTSAMAFDRGGADGFHRAGFHRGSLHRHSHDLHAGYSGFRGTHAGIRRGSFGHGWHRGWSDRRVVGGHGGWGYGPGYGGTYYEGVAPFGRMVGPTTGGVTFSVGL
jgi:hypothetical protein